MKNQFVITDPRGAAISELAYLEIFLISSQVYFKMRAFYYCDTVQRQCKETRSLFVKAPE